MTATAPGVAAYVGARLSGFKRQSDEYRGPCPIHGGRRDSFAINASTGLWRCHSECDRGGDLVELEMQLNGAPFGEAAQAVERLTGAATTNGSSASRIVATYDYTDELGDLLYQVVRLEPKSFRQRRSNGYGGWAWGLGDVERVLYRLPKALTADEVIVVEGEKDADTLERLGFAATTNSGGASQPWRDSYTAALSGKRVYIIPDADEPGRKHAAKVRAALSGKATSCKVVRLPDGYQDATDYVEAGHGADDVRRLLEGSEADEPKDAREAPAVHLRRFSEIEPEPIRWLWPGRIARGKVSMLAENPGLGKSQLTASLAAMLLESTDLSTLPAPKANRRSPWQSARRFQVRSSGDPAGGDCILNPCRTP